MPADRFTLGPSPHVDVPAVVTRLREAGVAAELLAGLPQPPHQARRPTASSPGCGTITAADLPVALDLLDRASGAVVCGPMG